MPFFSSCGIRLIMICRNSNSVKGRFKSPFWWYISKIVIFPKHNEAHKTRKPSLNSCFPVILWLYNHIEWVIEGVYFSIPYKERKQ